tara:strand:+ start:2477 stop:4435 length:1959 start_codon:yes stop_codon:yes gene_type:complete
MDNNTFKNYKNMSMEQLGSSLLGQKAAAGARRRRSSKRNEKIQKMLAVLLGGQAIFQNAVKDRMSEHKAFADIMSKKNKKFVAEMKVVGNVLDAIPTNIIDSENAYDEYLNNSSVQRAFRAQVRPVIANALQKFDKVGYDQAVNAGTIVGDINKIADGITAPYFLKSIDGGPSRAKMLLDAGEKYFEGTDRDKIFEELFAISEADVDAKTKLRIENIEDEIRGSARWWKVPGMLSSWFKGDPTIFNSIESGDYLESDLRKVFSKSINIGESGFITPNFSEVMKSWDNNKNYINTALGIEAFMDTSSTSRQAKALASVIRQAKIDLNEAPPSQWTKEGFEDFRVKKLQLLEEADLLRRAIYSESPTELDAEFGREVAKTWGGLRLLFDNPDREGAMFLEDKYNVDLTTMNLEEKDQFAMRIILAEGIDPIDPTDYKNSLGIVRNLATPNYASNIPGTLAIYERGGRSYEWGREGAYDESNFRNNLSKVQAYLEPTFKGISSDGIPEPSDSIKILQETGDADGVGGNNIANTLNSISMQDEEAAEAMFSATVDNNDVFATQVKSSYPTTLDASQALNNGQLSVYGGRRVQIDPTMTYGEPVDIQSWFEGQGDKQAMSIIERHLTGRAKSESGYIRALERLGMTDEEARQQFLGQ